MSKEVATLSLDIAQRWLLASETVSETESLRYRNIWRKVHDNEKINIVNIIIIYSTTDDFTTSFLHFPPFFTDLWDLVNSSLVHSLMLSSHLFLCLPCLLPSFTVPCKMVLARPDEREACPYHCSLRLFTMVRRSSCGPIACWILARTS